MRYRSVYAAAGAACALALGPAHAGQIVVGAGEGGIPEVRVFDAAGSQVHSFLAYGPGFAGGVRVAAGDVNGDGVADIVTGAGPGGLPHVKAFSGAGGAELSSFSAYAAAFAGGVYVAAGDIDGDGRADIVTGAGPGGLPHVRAVSGDDGSDLASFNAYDAGFAGGVRVATGDVNRDGVPDIITGAGPGGGPQVGVFSGVGGGLLSSFLAYTPGFAGGVFVASGDVDNDGFADIITGADAGGSPHVKVFSGATGSELRSFFAFDPGFTGGVRVAAGDVNGDGFADVITGAGPGGLPQVTVFSGLDGSVLSSFLGADRTFSGGVYVAHIPAPGAAGVLLAAVPVAARRRTRAHTRPGSGNA